MTHQFDLEFRPEQSPAMFDREWLLTNGEGSFAMGTVPGINARRYHGLLVAATHPPVGRIMAVNQFFERLVFCDPAAPGGEGDQVLEFSAFHFRDPSGGDHYSPRGDIRLVQFQKGLEVRWLYRWGPIEFERTLSLAWKRPAATVRYRVAGLEDDHRNARLFVSPMLTLRDFHGIRRHWTNPGFSVADDGDLVAVRGDQRQVFFRAPDSRFVRSDEWWYDVFYRIEEERGGDAREDLFLPGWFEWDIAGEEAGVAIHFGIHAQDVCDEHDLEPRRRSLTPMIEALDRVPISGNRILSDAQRRQLAIASDDFVVDRTIRGQKLSTILAGYPWFADWGRDTFISLPGLLLETGRMEEALKTLLAFSHAIRRGLVPNRFDDYDDQRAHYNTVDGSLWFVIAAMRYMEAGGDEKAWRSELAESCKTVLLAYLRGTDGPIGADEDGLIVAGNAGTQLTWMDAKCNGRIFTPRHGKAVEINALWYHALVGMARHTEELDWKGAAMFRDLAAKVAESFVRVFWNERRGCLNDTVYRDDQGRWRIDESLRPNQIFAAAFEDSPLSLEMRKDIVEMVGDHLLTPLGLRTLPVDDTRYHAHYAGDGYQRDEAYHQGTIWPWLIGPYAEAVLRCGGFDAASRAEAFEAISGLLSFMEGRGVGQMHEIHEAAPPHRPVGCPAQAWSVAEVIRVARLIELSARAGSRG
ncbi:MAG: glycogen debranching enzyme family protein [Phycisphaeraceae bacterium]|nr:glycogen debranching enzyme family protein [Phycisphaeraceae bacterium]